VKAKWAHILIPDRILILYPYHLGKDPKGKSHNFMSSDVLAYNLAVEWVYFLKNYP